MLTQRVEKEHDDVSFPPCVVKKLKVPAIDSFLDDFEAVLGDVVYLNNALFDALTDVRVSVDGHGVARFAEREHALSLVVVRPPSNTHFTIRIHEQLRS